MTHTHTFVYLDVSQQTFREIFEKLRDAGYEHALHYDAERRSIAIDMHGIALRGVGPVEQSELEAKAG